MEGGVTVMLVDKKNAMRISGISAPELLALLLVLPRGAGITVPEDEKAA